eukprot:GEZU01000743.1.p1 GENE.GEZU01000743.1~~GEZU01000743.1.p1  ORF type:complete len:205 (-),score=47.07 GEZU01000743.1:22-636(-)
MTMEGSSSSLNILRGSTPISIEQVSLGDLAKLFEREDITDHEQFLHTVVDELCGRPSNKPASSYANAHEIIAAAKALMRQAVATNLDEGKLVADLEALAVPASGIPVVLSVLEVRRSDIRRALMEATVALSQSHLKDFDWKLQLILSSDKVSIMRQPLLLLNLYIYDTKQANTREVLIELTKADLDNLLGTFAKIHEVIQSVTF